MTDVIEVSEQGPAGPPGPFGSTNTAANFTMPPSDGVTTATVQFLTTVFFAPGMSLFIASAGYLVVAAVIDQTHATLVNNGVNSNTVPGNTIASGSSVVPGGPTLPVPILGTALVGNNSRVNELSFDWISVPSGQTVTIATLPQPAIAFHETVAMSAFIEVVNLAGTAHGRIARMIQVQNVSGVITTPNGGTSDSNITPDTANAMATSLTGVVGAIVISAATLLVQVTNPTGAQIWARCDVSVSRGLLPGTGPIPVVSSTSVASGPGAGGTNGALTGLHFTGASSVTLFGVAATFSVISDTQINFTSGPFFGVPGAGDIVVTNLNGPGSLVGGWTYTSTQLTPLTIFGASLQGWYPNSNIQHSGAAITGWNDGTSNAENLTVGSGLATGYVASSTHITPNGPAVTFNGSSDYLTKASFVWGAATNPNTFVYIICRSTATAGQYVGKAGDGIDFVISANNPVLGGPLGALTNSATVQNNLQIVWAYWDGLSVGGSNVEFVTVNNGTPATRSGTNGINCVKTATLNLGGTTQHFGGEIYEMGVVEAPTGGPTANQLSLLHSYAQITYGTP
jgi:hypothetical protein